MKRLRYRIGAVALAAAGALILVMGVSAAAQQRGPQGAAARENTAKTLARTGGQATGSVNGADGDADLMDEQAQYGYERTAPAESVSGAAMVAASQQEREVLDEKLFFEVFSLDPKPAKKP